jgi:hypothetical protein
MAVYNPPSGAHGQTVSDSAGIQGWHQKTHPKNPLKNTQKTHLESFFLKVTLLCQEICSFSLLEDHLIINKL